jgi:hypothetical protein
MIGVVQLHFILSSSYGEAVGLGNATVVLFV